MPPVYEAGRSLRGRRRCREILALEQDFVAYVVPTLAARAAGLMLFAGALEGIGVAAFVPC